MPHNVSVLDELRQACAAVASRASHVRINHQAIPAYAAALELSPSETGSEEALSPSSREEKAAFWITLDAINFGSGWFPTLSKRPGKSGYFTIASGVRERFEEFGPWSAAELSTVGKEELAGALRQDPAHELMELFASSLNDLGRHLTHEHRGSFETLVDSAGGSAQTMAAHLAEWACFSDTSPYQELQVPFLKRAQIAAADLQRAGVSEFRDLDHLTMFADNLVPHVLRLDGILEFDSALVQRIEREDLIAHDSSEEVEIRACALQAVELIVASSGALTAAAADELLWRRGGEGRYKARPRHRSRTTAY